MNVDPISDFLTRIRNGAEMRHSSVEMPHSRVKQELARILYEEGFIQGYRELADGPRLQLAVDLKYDRRDRPVITHLKRISKRGRRAYVGWKDIPWVRSGLGVWILTTSQGIMTGQKARSARIGGEILCEVW